MNIARRTLLGALVLPGERAGDRHRRSRLARRGAGLPDRHSRRRARRAPAQGLRLPRPPGRAEDEGAGRALHQPQLRRRHAGAAGRRAGCRRAGCRQLCRRVPARSRRGRAAGRGPAARRLARLSLGPVRARRQPLPDARRSARPIADVHRPRFDLGLPRAAPRAQPQRLSAAPFRQLRLQRQPSRHRAVGARRPVRRRRDLDVRHRRLRGRPFARQPAPHGAAGPARHERPAHPLELEPDRRGAGRGAQGPAAGGQGHLPAAAARPAASSTSSCFEAIAGGAAIGYAPVEHELYRTIVEIRSELEGG